MEIMLMGIARWMVFLAYALTAVFYLRDFLYRQDRDRSIAAYLLYLALALHTGWLLFLGLHLHRIPVATVGEALTTFVWLSALMYLFLEKRLHERSMGTFILPILVVLLAISNSFFQVDEPIRPILKDVKFEVHVLLMLLAYGAFSISFIASLLHTLLDREIQKRNMGVFFKRLPSLAFFERLSNIAVDIGLVFTVLGFIQGLHNALEVWINSPLRDPKVIALLLTWFIYTLHFLLRKFAGWRGQRAAVISMLGFGFLMFSFLFITLFLPSNHRFF
jgi:ABC-type uncharacterized transport system permease subunit